MKRSLLHTLPGVAIKSIDFGIPVYETVWNEWHGQVSHTN